MNGRAIFVATVALLAIVLGGCSKAKNTSDVLAANRERAKALPMTVTGTGKSVEVSVPRVIPPGLTRIDFGNNAQGEHQLQIIKYDAGREPDAALAAARAWANGGKPLPDWVHPAGGTPRTEPRVKSTTTQNFTEGDYLVTDLGLKGQSQVEATFRVEGDREAGPVDTSAEIQEFEYGFKASGIQRGRTEVLIKNTGKQPHEVEAALLKPGKTIDDVKAYLQDQSGPSPVDNKNSTSTSVQDGGASQVTTLDFHQGNYVLLCFVPDRAGGPPHAFKGMVGQVQVR